jgi:hypothetical protein
MNDPTSDDAVCLEERSNALRPCDPCREADAHPTKLIPAEEIFADPRTVARPTHHDDAIGGRHERISRCAKVTERRARAASPRRARRDREQRKRRACRCELERAIEHEHVGVVVARCKVDRLLTIPRDHHASSRAGAFERLVANHGDVIIRLNAHVARASRPSTVCVSDERDPQALGERTYAGDGERCLAGASERGSPDTQDRYRAGQRPRDV